jgi:glycosyltransferase involved in cell wall biosynthesis
MKIGIADPNSRKFTQQLIDHWESKGHEIMYHVVNLDEHGECDVVFYDMAANNVAFYSKNMPRQKKVIVRSLDIENYMNYYQQFDWDKIDYFIFLNEHQKKLLTRHPDFTCPEEKIKIIPPGVNLNQLTLQAKKTCEKKAVFLGRGWIGKNTAGAIDVIYELNKLDPGWTLFVRADKADPRWWDRYVSFRAESLGVNVVFDKEVAPSINSYLEDMDLMIVPSFKEAFSYVAAEALAKGIPTVINNWYGAREVWDEKFIYNTASEAAKKYLLQKPIGGEYITVDDFDTREEAEAEMKLWGSDIKLRIYEQNLNNEEK